MTKKEYRKIYYAVLGTNHLRKEFWQEYKNVLMSYLEESVPYYISIKGKEFMKEHEDKKERMEKDLAFFTECVHGRKVDPSMIRTQYTPGISSYEKIMLGNCEAATPECYSCSPPAPQKQGNNPMRIENTTATAYITSEKSSDSVSRDYLLSRLSGFDSWRDTKVMELRKLFNMDASDIPQTYQGLIDAIKGDKFKLDEKKLRRLEVIKEERDMDDDELEDFGYGPFYAMIFTDLPKADRKGYDEALLAYAKQKQTTKDIIMTGTPADGLSAIQALDAWLPVGKAN